MARVASSCAALVAQRRGFSAAITAIDVSVKKVEEKAVKLGMAATEDTTEDKTAFWEPDPKTGDYRPVTGTKEVDPADLRAEVLKRRLLQQQ
ncbi:late embryogenis abundant protein 2-like [Aegilops tauschii subsp. strangulata]|uniref:Late embryogenesis abundant protein Lea5 n=2 Tax=Triticinae TaxID=1648030 RepID=A0A452YY45_AEGTS|nr:late embryogenis abundant protein 2-like [Aegilops tauschii subsp. strangulata]XP_044443135.1 late embryogenis abundant protein 2-like [Triticum aestivum]